MWGSFLYSNHTWCTSEIRYSSVALKIKLLHPHNTGGNFTSRAESRKLEELGRVGQEADSRRLSSPWAEANE
ncbi:hypothetical protein EYC80_001760 [Monilinia laxa]|uniref:Uncharacterized protein n=1 Tax=Monilinia laxa TaxID=61186 RepID=A0A5N6K5X0_MONLA|nr:hypothetical protein EYC80_001760 [Monilinia laxa]